MSASVKELQEFDREHIWHPACQMKDYEDFPAIPVVRGKGPYLYTADGKEILDIISSWWCNLLGHCNEEISEAIAKQAKTLEHVIFANFTHPYAIDLVKELLTIVPKGIEHFNFADNGSSAIEMALKIAFQYQHQIGQTQRTLFACLSDGYHGETIGALSVGSMDLYNLMYKPMMMENIHIEAPDLFLRADESIENSIEKAKAVFEKYHDKLCALIVEPLLQGAAGMRIYPKEYLKALYQLCKQYNVLFIADEIATGFGRTGKWFACDHAQITPDIMCLSKAITGGYMPMSIAITTQEIYDAFYADYLEGKAFMHSHTYAGNPLGCSAGIEVLNILDDEHIIENANKKAVVFNSMIKEKFSKVSNVGDIRDIGLVNAIELVKDTKTKTPFDSKLRLGYQIYKKALKKGVLLRPLGDVIYFNPPLIIDENDMDFVTDVAVECANEVLSNQ